jgi:hypothetical protein
MQAVWTMARDLTISIQVGDGLPVPQSVAIWTAIQSFPGGASLKHKPLHVVKAKRGKPMPEEERLALADFQDSIAIAMQSDSIVSIEKT